MDKDTVRERLAKLHAELADAHREDPAKRQALGEVLPDVKRIADKPPGDADASIDKTLPHRLERIAVQFEVQHPKLAATARQLIDLLAEVGI
ncbi:MAG: DUF4404 family protein [Pseudomonadota bacterium]|nr:DUF4404 family protein [Pseudomonadota bacterium]